MPVRWTTRTCEEPKPHALPAPTSVLTSTGSGGFTHSFFRTPHSVEDLVSDQRAIAAWARLGYGWMGRSPDYKASFLGTLGANAEFYAPFEANAKRWYTFCQERVPFVNHAIIHPPVDRDKPPDQVADVLLKQDIAWHHDPA